MYILLIFVFNFVRFGNNVGVFYVEGCIEKKDGCYFMYVDVNDLIKFCFFIQIIIQVLFVYNEQVFDNQVYRNLFVFKGQDFRYNLFNSLNFLYNFNLNEKLLEDKVERQWQYEFFLFLFQYYMINGS